MDAKYKRILLKVSGQALAGEKKQGIDGEILSSICKVIKDCVDLSVKIGVVVGAGNFFRGRDRGNIDRIRADHMGMLGTVMNALAIQDTLLQFGVSARVQTAITMKQIAEPCIRSKAIDHLEHGRVVIFACGTGNPFFSTDTAAALRAAEINAEVILKATMVDGVYDKDPKKYDDAVFYEKIKMSDVLNQGLKVIDGTAVSLCSENQIPILVFNMSNPKNILDIVCGESKGTILVP